LGSCNSFKSWQSALVWWVEANDLQPQFKFHRFYRKIKTTMVKLYKRKRKLRKPINIYWIVGWLKSKNITPTTWDTIDLDLLTESLLILLLFFSMSRPSEITFTDNTENVAWEIITTGLQWGTMKFYTNDSNYRESYLLLTINWYKNQEFRGKPKLIYMAPPICNNKFCHCMNFLDFYGMAKMLKFRRSNLTNCSMNLGVNNNNFVFVGKNGKIWRPSIFTRLTKDILRVNNVHDPENYAPYSFRIGSMSLAHQQEIDLLKVMRYVVWSIDNLPHVSNRYIRFSIQLLKTIPFELIHGRGGLINRSDRIKIPTFNLWDNNEASRQLFRP